eukprot:TRINITY_DN9379_c0_g2_i1.p1 TRINITY_DN9379_c0_g2~~TRINITY_DN9379_c0_g2_i1.p1  ORF type:complete len:426 (+),score=133.59 TRINITY_DN9379_c0_g2_i1:42-1319(+)
MAPEGAMRWAALACLAAEAVAQDTTPAPEAEYRPPVLVLAALQCIAVTLFLRYFGEEEGAQKDDESDHSNSTSSLQIVTSGGPRSPRSPVCERHGTPTRVRQRGQRDDGSDTVFLDDSDGGHDFNNKRMGWWAWFMFQVRTSPLALATCGAIVVISVVFYPDTWSPRKPTVQHVFYYAWITDLATGAGVLPFIWMKTVKDHHLGLANAVAAGMMSCASVQLFMEGVSAARYEGGSILEPAWVRCFIGIGLGALFILMTKHYMDGQEDFKVMDLSGLEAKKVLLIMVVMTLHSFTEGVGIGVAFGGDHGASIGFCIAVCLAIHNVPEGLAVALVLIPRGVSKLNASLWCIMTSFPQPLMAVPAFLFVEHVLPILPVGLGFAAGAMLWVAFFELVVEASGDARHRDIIAISTASFTGAYLLQRWFAD